MQMLEHPDKRKTWGVKSKPSFYIGTSLEHYRYFWGFVPETRSIRGSESVIFKHKYITNPSVTPADEIVHAAKLLTNALRGNIPPFLVKSGIEHLKELTNIFDTTKKEYEKREVESDANSTNANAHSPRVSNGSPSPRVAKACTPRGKRFTMADVPDLVPADEYDSDEEEEEDDPQLIVACLSTTATRKRRRRIPS